MRGGIWSYVSMTSWMGGVLNRPSKGTIFGSESLGKIRKKLKLCLAGRVKVERKLRAFELVY